VAERDIVIYVCHNARQAGPPQSAVRPPIAALSAANVVVREVPCSGKTDVVYLLRAFEGGARGVAVITCPLGGCRLAEGNYRAQVRVRHVGRLLDEIGLGRERLILLHSAAGSEGRDVPVLIEQAAERLRALPDNPIGARCTSPTNRTGLTSPTSPTQKKREV